MNWIIHFKDRFELMNVYLTSSTPKVHWNWREIGIKIAIQGKNQKKGVENGENTKTVPKIDQKSTLK